MIAEMVKKWCLENKQTITEQQLAMFKQYAGLLREWNEKMNLTAITDDEGIAVRHFIDSISILNSQAIPDGAKVIDIGTGAGFPGIPVKIMRPDVELYLLDSLNKRLIFLEEVCGQLGFQAQLIHSRAEDSARQEEYREQFDVVVSRAVANLPALCEYCLPYVKVGGIFIAMKGPDGENELAQSEKAFNILGGKVENILHTVLPDQSQRTIICLKKTAETPARYPRKGTKINKNPL